MGFLARAGSDARPGSERRRPPAGRRPFPSTGQNTVSPDFGLRSLRKNGYVPATSADANLRYQEALEWNLSWAGPRLGHRDSAEAARFCLSR